MPAEALARLRKIDDDLMESLTANDEPGFTERRDALLGVVRSEGKPVPDDVLRESDLVLPQADITLEEARQLFTRHA